MLQILLGISYSLLSSGLWPLVALIVPESQLGTAYGMYEIMFNNLLQKILICMYILVRYMDEFTAHPVLSGYGSP